jgi:S1-C subfamily serine protease
MDPQEGFFLWKELCMHQLPDYKSISFLTSPKISLLSKQRQGATPILPNRTWPLLLVTLLSILVLGCATDQNTTGTPTSEAARQAVIDKVRPTVVQINVKTAKGNGLGSGVILDPQGYIVTNDHVVAEAEQTQVMLYGGETLPAQVIGNDPLDDLAVVKINPPSSFKLKAATLGDSSKLGVGQEVLAMGSPLGITQTVTNGIISALDRPVGTIPDAIQTDAPINGGNSGGALIDLQGFLIGIPTSTAIDPQFNVPANGVGFAVPSDRVAFIVPQLIHHDKVVDNGRADLGAEYITVDAALTAQNNLAVASGVLLVNIAAGGAADQARLQSGDVIVQFNGVSVPTGSKLDALLMKLQSGDRVDVQFYRGKKLQKTTVTLR